MPNPSTLSLSFLIEQVKEASIIQEIVTDYEAQLIASKQFELDVIFPLLLQRMHVVENAYSTSLVSLNKLHDAVSNFHEQFDTLMSDMAAILSIITASDSDSRMNTKAHESYDQFKTVHTAMLEIQQSSNQELLDATAIVAIPAITKTHETISKQIINNDHSNELIVTQVAKFSNELHGDVRSLSTAALRKQLIPFRNSIVQLIDSVRSLGEYILKRKASNPLISTQLVDDSTKLSSNMQELNAKLTTTLNLLYVHSDDLMALNNAVLVYQSLAKLLDQGS